MNCMDCQKMIMPFINGELDNGQLSQFLCHLKTCPECMEELEVYYTLLTSMKQLDENQELSDNYHNDLLELIEKSEEKINSKNKIYMGKKVILLMIAGIIALASTHQIREYVMEDILQKSTESDFMPENITLLSKRDLPIEIERQLPDIYLYLRQNDKEGADSMYEYYRSATWNGMIVQREFGQDTSIPEWTVLHY